MKPIKVLIVDDYDIVRQGLRMLLDTEPTIQTVGTAKDGRQAIRQATFSILSTDATDNFCPRRIYHNPRYSVLPTADLRVYLKIKNVL